MLVVGGAVARPLMIELADLASLPMVDIRDDFVCREGWCVPQLHWRGPKLSDVLAAAGAEGEGIWVEVASGEFATVLARDEADRAILAVSLGGTALPREHGGPLRLIVPGADCYTSVKWVDRIDVTYEQRPDRAKAIALARIGEVAS